MSITKLLCEMCVIFIMISIGFYIRKKEFVTDKVITGISFIIANVTNPCILLDGAIQSGEKLGIHEFLVYFMWSVLLYALLIASSYLIPVILRIPRESRFVYKMLTIFGNTGFIGLPVCRAMFGNDCMVTVILFNVCFCLLAYTYGIGILRKTKRMQDAANGREVIMEETSMARSLLKAVNMGTICGVLAVVIYLVNPPIPMIIADTVGYVSDPTIFLSMIVLGSSVATAPLKEYTKGSGRMAAFLVVRMLALPIAVVLVMKQFIQDPVLLGTLTILMSLPGGNLPLIMCRDLGIEADELSKGIILSTIVCIVTIPIVCMFI